MAAVATVLAHLFVLVDVRSVLEAWLLMMEIWLGCGVMMRVANIAFAQKKKFHILAATAVGDLACLILMATVLVLMR